MKYVFVGGVKDGERIAIPKPGPVVFKNDLSEEVYVPMKLRDGAREFTFYVSTRIKQYETSPIELLLEKYRKP